MAKVYDLDRTVRTLFSIALIGAFVWLLWKLSGVLMPFLVASLMAYMINPLVEFIQFKMRVKRRVPSVILALVFIIGITIFAFVEFVPMFISQLSGFSNVIANFESKFDFLYLKTDICKFFGIQMDKQELLKMISIENIRDILQSIMPKVLNVVSGSLSTIVGIFQWLIALVYLIFILIDFDNIANEWGDIFPSKYRPFAEMLIKDVLSTMNSYFRGQAVVAFFLAIVYAVGFSVVGVPLGIGLGLFFGLLNLVPYLQLVGIIPMVMLCFLKSLEGGIGFFPILGLSCLVLVVAEIIQDIILVPKIMGKVSGLNPIAILLSLSIWGSLLGFMGMIVAIPLTTLINSYYRRFILQSESSSIPFPDDEAKDTH